MQNTSTHEHIPADWLGTSPDVPAVNANWQARRELAAALRRLNTAVLTSDAPTELYQSATAKVLADAARIEASARFFGKKAQGEHLTVPGGQPPQMFYEMTPAMGQSNAVAPPMSIWQADGRIHGLVTPDWSYEGPFEQVHGGVIALLFDQVLGTGVHLTGSGAYTGTLTVRYLHLTPLNKTLRLLGYLDREEGRKVFMGGELWVDDLLTATCEGIFIKKKTPPGTAPESPPPVVLDAD